MFTHVEDGKVRMVDVSEKVESQRISVAEGFIKLRKETVEAVKKGEVEKGNVLATSIVAGTLAVKRTWELIPMCHNIPVTSVKFDFEFEENGIKVTCEVKAVAKTGVEMEALTGVTIALLTIWDMVKSMEKDETGNYPWTAIEYVRVVKKVKGAKKF